MKENKMISNETREKWKDKLDTIIKSLDNCCVELNEWEIEFIDSIDKLLSDNKDLSFKQSKCLNKIYDKC
jgi:hypothetical protein